jgi:hypothetical protein
VQKIVHFLSKNENNIQLFAFLEECCVSLNEFLDGKGTVLGEAVCFISCDGLMQWSLIRHLTPAQMMAELEKVA